MINDFSARALFLSERIVVVCWQLLTLSAAVIVSAIHHIHNNPQLWDNPARFDPDRWDTDAAKHMQRNQYIPFATGGRMCIAYNFALQEVRTFLPKLVWRYKFVKEGESAVEYDPMFQLIRPINLYARAHKRVKWPPKTEALAPSPLVGEGDSA